MNHSKRGCVMVKKTTAFFIEKNILDIVDELRWELKVTRSEILRVAVSEYLKNNYPDRLK